MSGGEFVVEPDRWPLSRRQSFWPRGHRVLPGPLRSMPRRRRAPAWLVGLAGLSLAGLSLVAVVTLAPRSSATAGSEPAPTRVVETMPAPRVVGAAEVRAPAAPAAAAPAITAAPVADALGADQPVLRTTHAEPASAPAATPGPTRAAAPPLDLGQLPVLQLDATTFEVPSLTETAARPPARGAARAPAPRLAAQP